MLLPAKICIVWGITAFSVLSAQVKRSEFFPPTPLNHYQINIRYRSYEKAFVAWVSKEILQKENDTLFLYSYVFSLLLCLLLALIKYIRPVFVSRSDQDSRKKTVEEIKRRAHSGGEWPQVNKWKFSCTKTFRMWFWACTHTITPFFPSFLIFVKQRPKKQHSSQKFLNLDRLNSFLLN